MSEIQFNANLKKAESDEQLTEKTSLLLHNYKIILRLTVYTKSMS